MRKPFTLSLSLVLALPAAFAQIGIGPINHSVPSANQRVDTPATAIASGFQLDRKSVV